MIIRKQQKKLDSRIRGMESNFLTNKCDLLIVEDEISMQEFLDIYFRKRLSMSKIQSAKDGLEGLQKAKRFKPRIVLTGIEMPRINGLELIELIRRDPALKNTKIIVCTAHWSEDIRNRAFELGADRYLNKPFRPIELLSAVASYFIEADSLTNKCDLLIVEDDEQTRNLLRVFIQRNFPMLTIQSAKDGFEGLQKAKNSKPSIAWTGIGMPYINGLELIELIRRDPDLKNTKIIVCTGDHTKHLRNRAFWLGADRYLNKPFKVEEALSAVGSYFYFEAENGE